MTVIRNAIEIVIVTLCLPFYALVWPFFRWGLHSAATQVRRAQCASCGQSFGDIKSNDLQFCSVRLRLTTGANVKWDRLPKWRINCAACSTDTCFDRQLRITACDLSDALSRQQAENQP